MSFFLNEDEFQILGLIKQDAAVITRNLLKISTYNHGTLYNAIRSGEIVEFEKAMQAPESQTQLALVYEELMLRNVVLSFEMQVCVEKVLLNQRLFTKKIERKQSITPNERIEFTRELLNDLKRETGYNERFHFIAKFLAKNLRILKRQLKRKYRLPWEEMEFCLVAFVRAAHGLEELDLFVRMVLNSRKVIEYLECFTENLAGLNSHDFQHLRNDYQLIKNVYSLNRIIRYIDQAVGVDLQTENVTGKLVIERALQVLGEYLKSTTDSPHISEEVEKKLLESAPKYLREILTSLRNSLSHSHSLARRILIQQEETGAFFDEIQNDLKKIGADIFAIILDLKYDICKTFSDKLATLESQEDLQCICDDVWPFWCKEIRHTIYETKESIQNTTNLEELENLTLDESKGLYEMISDLVNRKINETSQNKKDYQYILNMINHTIIEKDLQIAKGILLWMGHYISRGKQQFKGFEGDLVDRIRVDARKLPRPAIVLTKQILYNSIVSGKKIKQIDRLNTRINEKQYEEEINYIFIEIAKLLPTQKETKSFWNNIEQKKVLHEAKMEILQAINSEDVLIDWVLSLIRKLKVGGKVGTSMEEALMNGKMEELRKFVKKIDDPYDFFIKSMSEANFFICDKYKKTLKTFFKKSIPLKETIVNDFISSTTLKIETYLLNRWELLKEISNIITVANDNHTVHWVAAEMLMLDITEIFNSVTLSFDSTGFLDGYASILVGKNLRNYLAHGDPLIDIMEYNPKVSLCSHICNIDGKLKSLSVLQDVLFGEDNVISLDDLKQRYTKGLAVVASQLELFLAILRKNTIEVNKFLQKGADPAGIALDGKTVLHICAVSNSSDLFKLFYLENAKINDSVYHTAVDANSQEVLNTLKSLCGLTPNLNKALLRSALIKKRTEIFESLLNEGVEINEVLNTHGNTGLHFAAMTGNKKAVETLIKSGAELELTDVRNETALHKACEYNHIDIVEELLNNGANIQAESAHNKLTPLHLASTHGHHKIVEMLLQKGADPNCATSRSTPLYLASIGGHKECVRLLLEANTDTDLDEITPLTLAAAYGHEEIISLFLDKGVALVGKNRAAFFETVLNGFENITKLLLEKGGADVNDKDVNGRTVLHLAAQEGHCSIVRLLLKHGAELEVVDENGDTPLLLATANNRIGTIKLLLENGANADAFNSKLGYKALYLIAIQGNLEAAKLFCNRAGTSEQDLNVALSLATFCNSNAETVSLLMDCGANVGAFIKLTPSAGVAFTPLHFAIRHNSHEIVKTFLKAGAPIDVTNALINPDGSFCPVKESALVMASALGHCETVRVLLERCKEFVNIPDDVNQTPLHYAVQKGHKDVVQLLLENGAKSEVFTLRTAVVWNHADVAEVLLRYRNDLIVLDEELETPAINVAAAKGYLDVVEVLLHYGARIEYSPGEKYYSPLHMACVLGKTEVVRFLLQKGANVDVLCKINQTPLQYGVNKGREDVVKILLEYGADITKVMLHEAVNCGKLSIVELVLEKNRDAINIMDVNGKTSLMYAAEKGLPDVVDVLLKNGALVNVQGHKGMTALHCSLKSSNFDVVNLLLENGADRSAICDDGRSALDILIEISDNTEFNQNDVAAVVWLFLAE